MKDNASTNKTTDLSRRGFLAGATAAASGMLSSTSSGQETATRAESTSQPTASQPTAGKKVVAGPTRLTEAIWGRAVLGRRLHPSLLREMLNESLLALTEQSTLDDAWHAIFKPDDVIGIKANQSGANVIGTSDDLITALAKSLVKSGFAPDKIVLIEVPERVQQELKTTPSRGGWQETEVDFGSGKDRLSAVLDQVTAILNVPFVKSHNIAGMTCGMKNLSHGLVKHPARYHGNGCSPYIADIVSVPAIREKLRLTVVNAFRVVFDGGPRAVEEKIEPAASLLLGTDPVASDTLALAMLDEIRRKRDLKPVGEGGPFLEYLDRATELGLGTNDLDLMDVRKIRFES